MPKKGQVLIDQFSGDTFEFLETAEDTNGKCVTVKVTLKSIGQFADDHIHLVQDETFKVLSGRMTYVISGEKKYLNVGEEITLPKNVPHNHYNPDDEPAVYVQSISPALDIDYFMENLIGLINDGKVRNGKLPFLQAMISVKYIESYTLLASIPRKLQYGLASILSPIARALGYRAIYKQYTGIEK